MLNLEARAQVVEEVLKIWFYNKTTGERVPMWDKDGESVQKLLGQEKLGKLTDSLMQLKTAVLPTDSTVDEKEKVLSPETLETLTQKANELLQEVVNQ